MVSDCFKLMFCRSSAKKLWTRKSSSVWHVDVLALSNAHQKKTYARKLTIWKRALSAVKRTTAMKILAFTWCTVLPSYWQDFLWQLCWIIRNSGVDLVHTAAISLKWLLATVLIFSKFWHSKFLQCWNQIFRTFSLTTKLIYLRKSCWSINIVVKMTPIIITCCK